MRIEKTNLSKKVCGLFIIALFTFGVANAQVPEEEQFQDYGLDIEVYGNVIEDETFMDVAETNLEVNVKIKQEIINSGYRFKWYVPSYLGGIFIKEEELIPSETNPAHNVGVKFLISSRTLAIDEDSLYGRFAKGRLTFKFKLVTDENYPAYSGSCSCNCNCHCGQKILIGTREIDFYKTFDHPHILQPGDTLRNKIEGIDCIGLGQIVTFSIEPWVSLKDAQFIGFDSVYWNIDNFSDELEYLYYSTDRSSVTFKVNEYFLDNEMKLEATMGKKNWNNGHPTHKIERELGVEPADPDLRWIYFDVETQAEVENVINWEEGLCVPYSHQTLAIKIDNYFSDVKYTWEELGGWTNTGKYEVGKDGIMFISDIVFGLEPKKIILRTKGDCYTKIFSLQINRELSEGINEILTNGTCFVTNTTTILSVPDIGENVILYWEKIEGENWSFVNGVKTGISVLVNVGTTPAIFSVQSICEKGIITTPKLHIVPEMPLEIFGPNCVEVNDPVTYNVDIDPLQNTKSYNWIHPGFNNITGNHNAQTGITNTTGNSIQLKLTKPALMDFIKVQAVGVQGCPHSGWTSENFKVGLMPNEIERIEDPICLNYGAAGDVTFTAIVEETADGTTYLWNIPQGFGIPKNVTADNNGYYPTGNLPYIKVSQSKDAAGPFKVRVKAITSCFKENQAPWVDYDFDVEPVFVYIPGDFEPWLFGYWSGDLTIEPTDLPNVKSIKWYLNNVHQPLCDGLYGWFGAFIPGQSLRLEVIIGECEVIQEVELPLNSSSSSVIGNGNTNIELDNYLIDNSFNIYPNPASNNITVILPQDNSSNVFLLSLDGKMLKNEQRNSSEFIMDLYGIQPGFYYLCILQGKQKYVKKIIIE